MATSNIKPRSLRYRAILVLSLIHVCALFALLPRYFSYEAVAVAALLHWVTASLGVDLGLHRLLSHRSFACPKWFEYCLAFLGTLACQGSVIQWVGLHRMHHQYADEDGDPHNAALSFWGSHIGWLYYELPDKEQIARYAHDIYRDPVYLFLERHVVTLQAALGFFLYSLGGWPFVVWGIFFRMAAVFHCAWITNSGAHRFGYRTYDTQDSSTNCWWINLVTYGGGWHNNHHAFPYSARHGFKWWEIDLTWKTIQLLQMLGLIEHVKLPEHRLRSFACSRETNA